MKTNVTQTFLLLLSSIASLSAELPTGFITSPSEVVRENTTVDLNWKVNLPTPTITQMMEFDGPQMMMIPKMDLIAEVRVLGAAMGSRNNPLWAEAYLGIGGGSETQIFAAFADGIGAGSSQTFTVPAGQPMNFTFRTWNGSRPSRERSRWGRERTPVQTGTTTDRLFIKQDGDEAPFFQGAFDQANSEAFIAPYLQEDGETLDIGTSDLLLFVEMNEQINNIADFQDFVVLISFRRA